MIWLSKVFKSHQCVEATPCRVELLEPAAFFISNQGQSLIDLETEEAFNSEGDVPDEALTTEESARAVANTILEQARLEGEQLVATARQQAEVLKTEARRAGEAAGYQAGLDQIRRELADNLKQALLCLSEAETLQAQRILESEPEILKLAIAVARKILTAELQLAPERQLLIVKQALSRYSGAATYKVRLHPADLEQLGEAVIPELQSVFSEPKSFEMLADPGVDSGGCYIETELGNIDARLKTQLELVITELLKVGQL